MTQVRSSTRSERLMHGGGFRVTKYPSSQLEACSPEQSTPQSASQSCKQGPFRSVSDLTLGHVAEPPSNKSMLPPHCKVNLDGWKHFDAEALADLEHDRKRAISPAPCAPGGDSRDQLNAAEAVEVRHDVEEASWLVIEDDFIQCTGEPSSHDVGSVAEAAEKAAAASLDLETKDLGRRPVATPVRLSPLCAGAIQESSQQPLAQAMAGQRPTSASNRRHSSALCMAAQQHATAAARRMTDEVCRSPQDLTPVRRTTASMQTVASPEPDAAAPSPSTFTAYPFAERTLCFEGADSDENSGSTGRPKSASAVRPPPPPSQPRPASASVSVGRPQGVSASSLAIVEPTPAAGPEPTQARLNVQELLRGRAPWQIKQVLERGAKPPRPQTGRTLARPQSAGQLPRPVAAAATTASKLGSLSWAELRHVSSSAVPSYPALYLTPSQKLPLPQSLTLAAAAPEPTIAAKRQTLPWEEEDSPSNYCSDPEQPESLSAHTVELPSTGVAPSSLNEASKICQLQSKQPSTQAEGPSDLPHALSTQHPFPRHNSCPEPLRRQRMSPSPTNTTAGQQLLERKQRPDSADASVQDQAAVKATKSAMRCRSAGRNRSPAAQPTPAPVKPRRAAPSLQRSKVLPPSLKDVAHARPRRADAQGELEEVALLELTLSDMEDTPELLRNRLEELRNVSAPLRGAGARAACVLQRALAVAERKLGLLSELCSRSAVLESLGARREALLLRALAGGDGSSPEQILGEAAGFGAHLQKSVHGEEANGSSGEPTAALVDVFRASFRLPAQHKVSRHAQALLREDGPNWAATALQLAQAAADEGVSGASTTTGAKIDTLEPSLGIRRMIDVVASIGVPRKQIQLEQAWQLALEIRVAAVVRLAQAERIRGTVAAEHGDHGRVALEAAGRIEAAVRAASAFGVEEAQLRGALRKASSLRSDGAQGLAMVAVEAAQVDVLCGAAPATVERAIEAAVATGVPRGRFALEANGSGTG
mmetsp:Transcript_15525/g.34502  ORF Transcript_15525/g.34502 Transcript_15525/m.34502 type:complete len:992 (-) Transcript_15525:73-3048(-)